MSTADHFHSMTDDQLAEWHMVTQRNTQLTNALVEEKRQRAEEKTARDEVIRQQRDELRARAELILDLTTRHANQMAAARRNAAGLVLALKALEALRTVILEGQVTPDVIQWPGEVFRAVQDADEVIRAYGIPF